MRGFIPPSGDRIAARVDRDAESSPVLDEMRDWLLLDSGTSALAVALLDARVGAATETPEVILPAYCCPQVLSAVRYAGAAPVLVDLEPDSSYLSLSGLRRALTTRTVAVVAINFCGVHERIGELTEALAGTGVRLVYDCCQWFPLEPVLQQAADYVTFSFGRGKPVSILQGGALASARPPAPKTLSAIGPPVAGPLRRARHRGLVAAYGIARHPAVFSWLDAAGLAGRTYYRPAHPPSYLAGYAAAWLAANVEAYRSRRHAAARELARVLDDAAPVLSALPGVAASEAGALSRLPALAASRASRDALLARFRRAGIGASALYEVALPNVDGVALDAAARDYPEAERFAGRLITLPTHSGVNTDHVHSARSILGSFVAGEGRS